MRERRNDDEFRLSENSRRAEVLQTEYNPFFQKREYNRIKIRGVAKNEKLGGGRNYIFRRLSGQTA